MENQLQVIVKESGLEATKAQYILEKFQNYFEIAGQWEIKAKALIVTDASQTAEMQMARTGRLFLREKRVAVEKVRKELKEQALREGKAIDGIANVLKALIVPIEEHLERQEKFVEIQQAAEAEKIRLEVVERMEKERIAKEKADAEEQERIRIENEKLKAEAIKREKAAEAEKKKHAEAMAEQQEKARLERESMEKTAKAEREKQAKILAIQKEKAEAEHKQMEEKARKEREKADAEKKKATEETARLQKILASQIECPFCHKKFELKKG